LKNREGGIIVAHVWRVGGADEELKTNAITMAFASTGSP
jgi:hypothetical protein